MSNEQVEHTNSPILALAKNSAREHSSAPTEPIFEMVQRYNRIIPSVTIEKLENVFALVSTIVQYYIIDLTNRKNILVATNNV